MSSRGELQEHSLQYQRGSDNSTTVSIYVPGDVKIGRPCSIYLHSWGKPEFIPKPFHWMQSRKFMYPNRQKSAHDLFKHRLSDRKGFCTRYILLVFLDPTRFLAFMITASAFIPCSTVCPLLIYGSVTRCSTHMCQYCCYSNGPTCCLVMQSWTNNQK